MVFLAAMKSALLLPLFTFSSTAMGQRTTPVHAAVLCRTDAALAAWHVVYVSSLFGVI
jgi:hypothetical protein